MNGVKSFSIENDELDKHGLKAINDYDDHISIERKDAKMNQSDYEKALANTRDKWMLCGE